MTEAGVHQFDLPVHEHDCERCVFIGSYRLRHPYIDNEHGRRSGAAFKAVCMGDLYLSCNGSESFYIVRYGIQGEYATTNAPARYILAPMVDGEDPYEPKDFAELIEQIRAANGQASGLPDVAQLEVDIWNGEPNG